MQRRFGSFNNGLWIGLAIAVCAGCSGEGMFHQERQAIVSVRATAETVGAAWISKKVSTAFARVALARTYQIAEATRTKVAASPETLETDDAAELAEACEQLAQTVARLHRAVNEGDSAGAQRALDDIRSEPTSR